MQKFLLRRLLQAVLVVWASATVVFFLVRLTGDPVEIILPPEAPAEARIELTRQMGLDRPLPTQYAEFLSHALRGNIGESFWQNRPALAVVLERYPATLQLAVTALLISVLTAVPLGILAATRKGTWIDHSTMTFALLGHAMPTFWLGLLLILVFAVHLQWLPAFGRSSWDSVILPAVTLASYSTARLSRLTRSSMLEVLELDYMRTAASKGLSPARIIWVHGLRNAMLPILTLAALEFGVLLGGTVLTEIIFAWPGLGWLAMEAISRRDFPLVQAIILVVTWSFVVINLVTDILYAVINPRIRFA